MSPFDFEAAKAGAAVQTVFGHRVRIIRFDRAGAYPIVALVWPNDAADCEKVCFFDKTGTLAPTQHNRPFDKLSLCMVTKHIAVTYYINVYKNNASIHPSVEEAEAQANVGVKLLAHPISFEYEV
jgi:hypothetical protein